jgi:hypothetical protein
MIQKVCNISSVMTSGSNPEGLSARGDSFAESHADFVALIRNGNHLHEQVPNGNALLLDFSAAGNWKVNCYELG